MNNGTDNPIVLAHRAFERLEAISILLWASEIENFESHLWKELPFKNREAGLFILKQIALQHLGTNVMRSFDDYSPSVWLNIFKSIINGDLRLLNSSMIFPPLQYVFLELDDMTLFNWSAELGAKIDTNISYSHVPKIKNIKHVLLSLGSSEALFKAGSLGIDLWEELKSDFELLEKRVDAKVVKDSYKKGYELYLLEKETGQAKKDGTVKSL